MNRMTCFGAVCFAFQFLTASSAWQQLIYKQRSINGLHRVCILAFSVQIFPKHCVLVKNVYAGLRQIVFHECQRKQTYLQMILANVTRGIILV